MKKTFVLLAGLVLALGLMVGCAKAQAEVPASDVGSEQSAKAELAAEPEGAEDESAVIHPEGPTALSDEEIEEIKVLGYGFLPL